MLRNSRLSVHLVFWYMVLFVIIATTLVLLVNWQMRQQALTEAERQASLLLDRNLATHTYFTHELKPNIFKWTESFRSPNYFDPSWMSSTYAVRQMDKIFHQLAKEPYYYKESSINARSPEAEADDYEKGFLKELQKDSNLMRKTDIRYFDGQPYLTVLRRGEPMESSCMRCHTTPDLAPKGMVDIYGPDRSFGRNLDEVIQAISIRIPLASAYAGANKFSLHLSLLLLTLLLGGFGLLFVFTKRKIITPIEQISNKAILIANSSEHLGETILEPQSSELKNLAQAFNMMSISLKKSMDEIEARVAERTVELRTKNVLLAEEIGERLRTEDALRESELRMRSMFDSLEESVLIVTPDRNLKDVNPATVKIFGYEKKDIIGRSTEILHVDHDHYVEFGKRIKECFALGASAEFQFESKRANGEIFPTEHTVSQLRDVNGMSIGIVSVVRDITERKRDEEALRLSEGQKNAILNGITTNIAFVDDKLQILWVNKAAAESVGLSPQEMIGATCYSLWADPTRPCENCPTIKAFQTKKSEETIITTPDGRIWNERGEPIFDDLGNFVGVVELAQDITEFSRLTNQEKLLITAIDQAAEAVIITDANGIIQYVNPAQESLSGYTRDEIVGQNPNIFKSDFHDDNFYAKLWETINAGNIWSGRFINKRKDGTEYHEDATISPVYNKSGDLTNFVAVKHDVTDQIKLQEQFIQSQKMEAVGTLAGGISHDFNNVLQPILGYSELLLLRKKEGEPDYADIQKIYQAGLRGADMIKSLMTFSRKTETEFVPVDLNQEITLVQYLLSQTIPKTIKIDVHLSEVLESIQGDSSQIGQVLMNLGVNARDAMTDGGILTIETANIQLDKEDGITCLEEIKPGSYVLLTVSDTGQGMDKETLSHIFEPFFTTKEEGKGTGLGLATVYGIVNRHGGHISCYSEPGIGTSFKIYLPAIQTKKELETPTFEKAIPGGTETIFLVEDDESIRNLSAAILNKFGYKVITAGDGKEALEIYQVEKDHIDLIMLDLIMPIMDGKKCLEEILYINPNAKVVIASGYSEGGQPNGDTPVGAKGFVQKPYDIRELLTKIREVLDKDNSGPVNTEDRL